MSKKIRKTAKVKSRKAKPVKQPESATVTEQVQNPPPEPTNPPAQTVKIARQDLQSTLAIANDFTAKAEFKVILGCVRITTGKDFQPYSFCKLQTTDLEISYTHQLPYVGDQVDKCIPLDILLAEVKALPSDITEVELTFTENKVQINGRCEIYTNPGEEYPEIKTVKGEVVEIIDISEKLNRVIPAAAVGYNKGALSGVCFDFPKGHIVAADGNRLHLEDLLKIKNSKAIILPLKTALLLAKHSLSGSMTISEDRVSCDLSLGKMTSMLVEGKYPDYGNVIPKDNPVKSTFSGKEFLRLIDGVMPVSNKNYRVVTLSINGRLEIEIKNADIGQYKWHIPCQSEGKHKDITIAFNIRYLVDAIRAYTTKENDNVVMEIKDQCSPMIINQRAVVMPIEIKP